MTAAAGRPRRSVGPPGQARSAKPTRQPSSERVPYEFVPDPRSILEEIVPVSFKVRLFKCFLDAAVSEQIARMVAMRGRDRERRRHDQDADRCFTTAPANRRSPANSPRSSAGPRPWNDARNPNISTSPLSHGKRNREPPMATATATGQIAQVIGSTFDAEFDEGHLPEIYNALTDRDRGEGGHDRPDRRGPAAPRRQPGPLRGPGLDRRPGPRDGRDRHRRPGDRAGRQGDARAGSSTCSASRSTAVGRSRPPSAGRSTAIPRRSTTSRPRPRSSRPASRSSTCSPRSSAAARSASSAARGWARR